MSYIQWWFDQFLPREEVTGQPWHNHKSYHHHNKSELNDSHFADGVFKYIALIENDCISIKCSLKSVLKSPINNMWALVKVINDFVANR